jgi:hypothetical protein
MEIITALISAVIGGIVATVLKSHFDKQNSVEMSHKEIIKDNYKSLLIFMACALDIEKRRYFSLHEQVPNKTSQDYLNQLEEYYYHSVLYSTDRVIIALKLFINNPSKQAYINVAKEMRKELWSKTTKLDYSELILREE